MTQIIARRKATQCWVNAQRCPQLAQLVQREILLETNLEVSNIKWPIIDRKWIADCLKEF